CQQYKDVLPTF
nr:immunoglobulin light chain junction region [Macaca mulatta]MOX98377.1 immunoglobulin light chain junction region [Macaca mulatta]MOX98796.1 immunoglobulin light chain junction region [Macaca mulatta]MOX98993.1 immunoglobulin light chain junction region [Macaca mulatta]MOY00102.1 immunoglobulin light chain junction region [Macaca mulatta]